ncbi:TetR family transcriptional regulator [Actinomadura sp. CNU-125]|uniref:TetR/AcrR family transcriptional regulator n=1 Tax=Actinomadura sp. CNU-125 TaxID=1904961 RepID=UPI0009610994|nr:WHG domain-containing protein [Actinomadura sp. CNU-125]OLT19134.1 TetR family transcriptional regulator [Actinomadura sp. CNU-125]
MSPRRSDPGVRPAMVEIAARLMHEEGPRALTARRVAQETGRSTMLVYTHFGGMSGLVREIVHVGFARLEEYFARVPDSADPVADMALFGRAYRHNAMVNPHLYSVMFGASSLPVFSLSESDRLYGRYTLVKVAHCAKRCVTTGRFRWDDADLVANHMWIAVHGLVSLELGGYLADPFDADRCFEAQLAALMVGVGDDERAARESVQASRVRFEAEFGPGRDAEGLL